MKFSTGDVFVERAPSGSTFYAVVIGKEKCITFHVASDGNVFDIGFRTQPTFVGGWNAAKYGDPVPVEPVAAVEERAVLDNAQFRAEMGL